MNAAIRRSIGLGVAGMAAMIALYLSLITPAQGWTHALQQLAADRWFVGLLALAFGVQIGLFTYVRSLHRHVAASGMAASGGMSTTAMLACCAHHLADVLPVVGFSSVAFMLGAYKTPLLWVSLLLNLGGIAYFVRHIRQQQRLIDQASVAGATHDCASA